MGNSPKGRHSSLKGNNRRDKRKRWIEYSIRKLKEESRKAREIGDKIRNLGYVELQVPYIRGWDFKPAYREDVSRRPDFPILEEIKKRIVDPLLPTIWSRKDSSLSPEFTNYLHHLKLNTLNIREEKWNYPPKFKKYFFSSFIITSSNRNWNSYIYTPSFEFKYPFFIQYEKSPHWVKEVKAIDGELEALYAYYDRNLFRYHKHVVKLNIISGRQGKSYKRYSEVKEYRKRKDERKILKQELLSSPFLIYSLPKY